jgi:ribosomal protein S18 acetylase RimI-like enzyme
MEIQLATADNLLDIMYLLFICIKDMNRKGMFHWNQVYPSLEIIVNDIQNKSLYILRDNWVIKGIIVLNEDQPDEYKKVTWRFGDKNDPVLVIHRLAVHPIFQQQGIGNRMMEFAIGYARKNNYRVIRLDVFEGNPYANNLYSRSGFLKAGKFRFPFQETKFVCYEKKLKKSC